MIQSWLALNDTDIIPKVQPKWIITNRDGDLWGVKNLRSLPYSPSASLRNNSRANATSVV